MYLVSGYYKLNCYEHSYGSVFVEWWNMFGYMPRSSKFGSWGIPSIGRKHRIVFQSGCTKSLSRYHVAILLFLYQHQAVLSLLLCSTVWGHRYWFLLKLFYFSRLCLLAWIYYFPYGVEICSFKFHKNGIFDENCIEPEDCLVKYPFLQN